MPDFSFVWFTYALDHNILLRSVKSVATTFPGCPLIIVDDGTYAAKPKSRIAAALRRMGVVTLVSITPRKGNLRGWACAKNIAETLRLVMHRTKCKAVVKIDSDALMLSRRWLEAFLANDKATYGGVRSRCGRAICGPTYALKKEAVDILCASYVHDMESPYMTEEDFEMCSRLWRHYGGKDEHMMQIPYAMRSDRGVLRTAQAGMFFWNRNILQEHKVMLGWDEIVFGARREPYEKGADWTEYALRTNRERAAMMKHLWNLHLQRA